MVQPESKRADTQKSSRHSARKRSRPDAGMPDDEDNAGAGSTSYFVSHGRKMASADCKRILQLAQPHANNYKSILKVVTAFMHAAS
jgi:hypothetical protein